MNKKILMIKGALFLIWSMVIIWTLNFVLERDPAEQTSANERIMMHEFYHQTENIDLLFLGSSHVYCSIDPRILDERTSRNTFIASSSGQTMDLSLALLKEAMKGNTIEEVYLEMYFEIMSPTPYKERTDLFYQYLVADYMEPSIDRVAYLLQAGGTQHLLNSFLPAKRNITKLLDLDYVKWQIKTKLSDAYRNHEYGDAQGYVGKGFIYYVQEVETEALEAIEPIERMEPSQDYMDDFHEMIRLCKEAGIALTLFTAPMPEQYLDQCEGGYDLYVQCVQEWAEEHELPYYDFNLCKEMVLELEQSDYRDVSHLNGAGAQKFTEAFYQVVYEEENPDVLFYPSYRVKRSQD